MRARLATSGDGGTGSAYAVVWREGDGPVKAGKLELGAGELSLRGSGPEGSLARQRVAYEDVAEVRLGRSEADRISGHTSLILDRRTGPPVAIAAIGGPGIVFELGDLLAELASESTQSVSSVVIVLPIKRGCREKARRLIEAGPPFDPETIPLERHQVFLTDREVVFVFEGEEARRAIDELARQPGVWKAASAWKGCLRGRPRVAEQGYGWARPRAPEHR